jgi:dihydroorotate dehydrogenase electron transfer subunit
MAENLSKSDKGPFLTNVCFNKQIRPGFYLLGLEFEGAGAAAFAGAKPGQFAQLDLSIAALAAAEKIPEHLRDSSKREIFLRRPFSFCDIAVKGGKTLADILYHVVGPASLRMTTLSAHSSISVIGPLGNGFQVPQGKKTALLLIGGIGVPPLLHLAKVLTADYPDIDVIAFAGAKTAEELPFEGRLDKISQELGFSLAEFARYGIKSSVATDDGSAGYHGLVTDCLLQWLGQRKPAYKDTVIYACGPEAMLAKVAQIAADRKIDCQLSMERMMACGIGVCQSCAVECKAAGSSETVYKLCCKDGPVFDAKEIVFQIAEGGHKL